MQRLTSPPAFTTHEFMKITVQPELLAWARDRVGLSGAALAKKLGAKPEQVARCRVGQCVFILYSFEFLIFHQEGNHNGKDDVKTCKPFIDFPARNMQ